MRPPWRFLSACLNWTELKMAKVRCLLSLFFIASKRPLFHCARTATALSGPFLCCQPRGKQYRVTRNQVKYILYFVAIAVIFTAIINQNTNQSKSKMSVRTAGHHRAVLVSAWRFFGRSGTVRGVSVSNVLPHGPLDQFGLGKLQS